MKASIFYLVFLSFILLQGTSHAAGVSDYPPGTPAGGILGSRHNLGESGKVFHTHATTEVCIFCHTPHHSNSQGALSPAPLWNKAVNPSSSYSAYGTTIGGTSVSAVGSVSLACLSCHDGVSTFDSIVNAPGKDGVVQGGSARNWIIWMPGDMFHTGGTTFPWNPIIPQNFFDTSEGGWCNYCHNGIMGLQNPAKRLSVGMSLADDHPVSVPYNGGTVASLRDPGTTLNSIVLTAGLHPSAASAYGGNLTQNLWAVKGFVSDTATIQDLLKDNKVECSSCHDPHFRNLSWDETEPTWDNAGGYITYCTAGEDCSDGNFLRRVGGNTGSAVCKTCHNK